MDPRAQRPTATSPASATSEDSLALALAASQRAVVADVQGRDAEALHDYRLALDLLQRVLKEGGQSPASVQQLKAKMDEYERRIGALAAAQPSVREDEESALLEKPTPIPSSEKTAAIKPAPSQGKKPPPSPLDLEYYTALQDKAPAPAPLVAVSDVSDTTTTSSASASVPRAVGRRGERALTLALRHAAHAAHLDQRLAEGARDTSSDALALRAYLIALDYFAHAAEHAPSGVLASINRTMKTLMQRAEALKASLTSAGCSADMWTPTPEEVHVDAERVLSAWHGERVRGLGVDTRLGPLTAAASTALWNDRRVDAVSLRVSLARNVLPLHVSSPSALSAPATDATAALRVRVALVLRASATVKALRVSLVQIRSACMRVRGPVTRSARVAVAQVHAHATRFPLEGPAEFGCALWLLVPRSLEPSECDGSASFALEYEVHVAAVLDYHDPVSVALPLRLTSE